MPELPEVETVARDLRRLVVGARISGVRVLWLRTLRSQDPEAFARAVVGRGIVGTSRRAKLVVLDLDGGIDSEGRPLPDDGLAITIHLKMTGQLFVVERGREPDPYTRLLLEFDDGRELRFRDIRKFGRVGVARRDGTDGDLRGELGGSKTFKGFGPEPLDPGFTSRTFTKRLRARKGRLKPVLLDQSFLAGIGNIYADEALWAARLHPLRSAASLRAGDHGRLYREVRRILAEAIERRGSSVDDYTAPEGDGSMQEQLRVYQRAGEPCFRCGRPVRRVVVGGRATHFCSWCQRLPPPDKPGAAPILRTMEPRPGARPGTRLGARAAARYDGEGPRRRGPVWTDLGGDGPVGGSEPNATASRVERTRRAAATRRATARGGAAQGSAADPGEPDRG
jgi:formamidopyrimidine-DNA glycosylase